MQCVRHVVNTNFLGVGCRVDGYKIEVKGGPQKATEKHSENNSQVDLKCGLTPSCSTLNTDSNMNISMKNSHTIFSSDDSSDSDDSGVTTY